ncbi:MAG: hypothetical protein KDD40_13105, partial [Bdellovibrionales bacterium]|nr:hypothetical protein [Bdellovibrionales bacterium]
ESFFTLAGPSDKFVKEILEKTSNPYERSVLSAILHERELFRNIFEEVSKEANEVVYSYAVTDLEATLQGLTTDKDKREFIPTVVKTMAKVKLEIGAKDIEKIKQSQLNGKVIGMNAVTDYLDSLLKDNYSHEVYTAAINEIESTTQDIINEIVERKRQLINEHNEIEQKIISLKTLKNKTQQEVDVFDEQIKNIFSKDFESSEVFPVDSELHDHKLVKMGNDWLFYLPQYGVWSVKGKRYVIQSSSTNKMRQLLISGSLGEIRDMLLLNENLLGIIVDNSLYKMSIKDESVTQQVQLTTSEVPIIAIDKDNQKMYCLDYKVNKLISYELSD